MILSHVIAMEGSKVLFPRSSLFPSLTHYSQNSSGCSTFTGLPAGRHRVRAISRDKGSGDNSKKFTSEFFYFTTE